MADYIKLNNEWKEILGVYKKVNNEWILETDINSSILTSNIYIYSTVKIDNTTTYIISGEDSYIGKTFNLTYIFNNRSVMASWEIISGSEYASINSNGKVTIEPGVSNEVIIVKADYNGNVVTKTITISYDNQLEIENADTIEGTTGNVVGRFNGNTVNPEWSIIEGSSLATIDNRGNITIINSGTITIQAIYHGYTVTKEINLVYNDDATTQTTVDESGNITHITNIDETDPETGITTNTTITTIINDDGSSITTSTALVENADGSSTTTSSITRSDGTVTESTITVSAPDSETGAVTTTEQSSTTNPDNTVSEINHTLVENQDGSSESVYSTTNYDENGNKINSSESEIQNNSDGSSSSITTNYDENDNPIDKTNQSNDVDGNTLTQNIVYDINGNEIVTGYDIDTGSNEDGYLNSDGASGINTEYYAFDMTHGFELNLHFTIDFTNQPPNQNDGHHNILAMKRQSPQPWYGLQIRQSSTNKYIQLGTQFTTGSNTNKTITTTNANKYNGSSNIYEYNIRIIYDPTKSTDSFICDELIGDAFHISNNNKFPDLDELKYIKTTLGCAMDENGNFYRFSNINIFNFSIKKLRNIENPVITCEDGQTITITCETAGSTIYYKLKDIGSYSEYTGPITIHEDTLIQTYSQLNDEKSEIIADYIIYDNGIEEPEIDTINNHITISCTTPGVTIYYRLQQLGHYEVYTDPIAIEEDTLIETYAQLNGERSDIISATCLYDNGIETPVITCNGEFITISCSDANATIYYRLNESGNYSLYTSAIEIFENTTVEAYVESNGVAGHIASENCIYEPIIINNPVIFSNGPTVTITCSTNGAAIYYKVNNTGNFTLYTAPIPITEDTVIQAYSTIKGKLSDIITENCIYSNVHDYSLDYLTFKILTAGNIVWRANGSLTKTIEYSLNNGAWTSITSSSTPITISVVANDTIRFRGTNNSYATSKSAYSGFGYGEAGTSGQSNYDTNAAEFNVEGNIMSLIYGDNFVNTTTFNSGTYNFCSLFKKAKVISAENLILPATILTEYCYRAMFSWCTYLTVAPQLPATTLAKGVYWYMFESCSITTAPNLLAETLVAECYGDMFINCSNLNFIKCLANSGFGTSKCLENWVKSVNNTGTFIKDSGTTWSRGVAGIPSSWTVYNNVSVNVPEISFDGFNIITLTCDTQNANIYYKLNKTGEYLLYSNPITINSDTFIQVYGELNEEESRIISKNCIYVSNVPIEYSNRYLKYWDFGNQEITTPYSVNGIDGHSASYSKGSFTFETSFNLRQVQPAQLWFQHADQSAEIYIDNTLVTKHWGGYTSFNVDISNYVHAGTNNVKVILKNNEGNNLAPASADFNFNATLGNVKLLTSPCIPGTTYGYDGFHIASTVTDALATINIKTTVPTGTSVVCTINDGTYYWTDTQVSDGTEMTFTNNISNPHLWNGKSDPHLYNITLELYKDNILYHRFIRPYGFRYYEYVIDDTTILANEDPYTGFLLNGQPYLLRGVCMHDDIAGKANALNEQDYNQTFNIITELNCNFLRLAHYPHPKEVYDRCDELGIIVQTEGPCVNKMESTMPTDYFDHLELQYADMVNQHMNHPCIIFWGLSNETKVDDKDFAKAKAEAYSAIIKGIHPEAWIGYVLAQAMTNPITYYNNPDLEWFGCNIYVGWYDQPNLNHPINQLNTRIANVITSKGKMLAFAEYGCGGTQSCHSDNPLTTTTRGNNERHDIEYMMWLHEGHVETIKNYPQLVYTAQWQLFDIAVSNRNEGYTVCLDGVNTSYDDSLRRLNNKGLVERDHITKKDPFYLYKAWWNPTPFIHICCKDYLKTTDRVIKCYTNDSGPFKLYVNPTGNNDEPIETILSATNYVVEFTSHTFNDGDTIMVEGLNSNDTFIINNQ